MSSDQIKFFLVYDLSSGETLYEYDIKLNPKVSEEAHKILIKIKAKQPAIMLENKVVSSVGVHSFIVYPNNLFFLVTSSSEVQPKVFETVRKVSEIVGEEESLSQKIKTDILHQIKALTEGDKLSAVSKDLESIENDMKTSAKKVVSNINKGEEIDKKAEKLNFEAAAYKEDALTLKRTAWWQNFKLTLIIAALVLTIILAIYFMHS